MIARLLTDPGHARNRSLTAAILCAALAGCGFGLLMPLISLNLNAMTGSGAMVGLNAAAAALSTILATPFIPALLKRFPARQLMAACALITGLGIAFFPVIPDVYVWWGLRLFTGMAVTVIFVGSETWINQLAKPESRASLLALYATVLSAGFGSGGLLLTGFGAEGITPWLVASGIFLVGALPLLVLRGPGLVPPDGAEAGLPALAAAARLAPVAILAGLVFGAMETGIFTLAPVYAARIGLGVETIGLIVAAGALGGIALQIPIGRLADQYGRIFILRLVACAALILPLLIALAGASLWALFPLFFLFAGISSAFYTLGLALLGERVRAGALAAANSAFIFAYGVGSLVGPPAQGLAMDASNPQGLMIAFAVLALVYLLGSWREKDTAKH